MEFLFELWIHRGLPCPYYAEVVWSLTPALLGSSFWSILRKQF